MIAEGPDAHQRTDGPAENQYHEPSKYVLILVSSYVRRVVRTTEHPKGSDSEVTGVKVYRVDYYNPPVEHFHAGREPLDPTLYLAYYCGSDEYATDTAVYTQTGWFTQERRIAPISRIQTVDSEFGVLERLFGLANVTVTTASAAGPIKVHGLDKDTASQLVAQLTSTTAATPGDAT